MNMKIPRILSAKIADSTTLLVQFSNHEWRKYDITQLWDKPMFYPLRDFNTFKNFTLDNHGYGIIWNEEIDISEYEIWVNGQPLSPI
jgi:hypothetical protein